MSYEFLVATAIGVLVAGGIFLALRARTFQVVLGLTLISYAVNLFLFASGRLVLDRPPIWDKAVSEYTDPLPQALVLTAIVIGFALTCFSLVLIVRLVQASGSDDAEAIRHAEPRPGDPLKPPVEDAPVAGKVLS